MAIKKTLNIFAIVVAMMFNQIVIPMNVKAYDDVDETEIVCYYSEYEDDSEDDEVNEDYEEEHYEETDEDYEEAYSEAEVWEDWDIFFGYTEFDDEDEEIDEDEDSDYDEDEDEYEDYDDEDYSDDEEDEDDDEYWDDEDEWVDDCDDDWDDDEDYPDDDDDYVYEYDCTPTYVEDRLTASCLNDSEQAQNVADTYGFTLLSYDNGVALFDTNGQDPLSYVNGDIELPNGLYFQLVVETEFEPVDDDFELPTDDDGEDDGYTDGIEIGVDISEIDAIMDLVDGDEPSEEIIEENFEIGIDE
jgi:hypothetical protein